MSNASADLPGNDSDFSGGGDDGDFDLSGFADASSSAPEPKDKPASPRAPSGKPPAKAAGKAPKAGGYDRPKRAYGDAGGYGSRDGARPTRDGSARGPGAPRPGGYGPREGGSNPGGPRAGGYGSRDSGSNAGGARSGGYGPREGGPRGAAGGFRKTGPGAGRPEYGDRPPRGEGRPFTPRDDRGGRFENDGPRGAASPRRIIRPAFVPRVQDPTQPKPASPEVKPWLPLKQDKGRWRDSRFLLEGSKNIADALAISPAILHQVFVTEDLKDKDLLTALKKFRIATTTVTMDDIRNLADTEAPQGVIAVCNFATLRPDWNLARYVTILDAVQDPGNVGAIFRTSAALGMDALVLGKGTCDPYNPKVVRSSVGAIMGLPFETGEDLGSKINFLRQKNFTVVATSSHAKQTLEQAKLRKKVALIVGNEGAGTGASYLDMADTVVKIPLKSKVESLNVAVAHGILSYQLIHGRE